MWFLELPIYNIQAIQFVTRILRHSNNQETIFSIQGTEQPKPSIFEPSYSLYYLDKGTMLVLLNMYNK
jgi:hypothetical protein